MTNEERVKQIITEHLSVGDHTTIHNAQKITMLGGDSLDAIEIVMACEEYFEIDVGDHIDEFDLSVGDIIALFEKQSTGE